MLPAASTRPDASTWAGIQDHNFHLDLLISVRSGGRWAAFAAHKSVADCMLRHEMVKFSGAPAQWAQELPQYPGIPHAINRLEEVDFPLPLPGAYGALIIDYDARRAWSLQHATSAFHLSHWWGNEPNGSRTDWSRAGLEAGHFPVARLHDSLYPLPAPPEGVQNAVKWLTQQATRAWAREHAHPASAHITSAPGWELVDGPEPGTRLLLPMARAKMEANDFEFPLCSPGWEFIEDLARPDRSIRALADHLHPGELDAWEIWACDHAQPKVAAEVQAARRRHAAARLDVRLPAPGTPVPHSRSPRF